MPRLRAPQPAPADDAVDRPARTFGYARVSTDDQNFALQLDALRTAGYHEVFEDRISGKTTSRPALDRLGRVDGTNIACVHQMLGRG